MKALNSEDLHNKFVAAGIVPDHCKRIIIDIALDSIVQVYYQCNADERLLNVGLVDALLKDGVKGEKIDEVPNVVLNINAIDTQSGADFITKNKKAIANSVQDAMKENHPTRNKS